MKNQTMKNKISTGMTFMMGLGMLLLLNDLMAQESTRRVVRGSGQSAPPTVNGTTTPSTTGAANPLGEDPTRAEAGDPFNVPGGGLGNEMPKATGSSPGGGATNSFGGANPPRRGLRGNRPA